MSVREKVILFFMLGTVVFGGWKFFGSSSQTIPDPQQKDSPGLDQFIVAMAGTLNKKYLFEADYILQKAASVCPNDPFVTGEPAPAAVEKTGKTPTPDTTLAYTGYVMVGNHMVAVINGTEYESGDRIGQSDQRVSHISPEQVELQAATGEKTILQLVNENL